MHSSDRNTLKRQLRRYQKENAALRRQLAALKHNTPPSHRSKSDTSEEQARVRSLFASRIRRARHYNKRTYLRFLIDSFTDSSFYIWWGKVLAYFRRIRLVRTVGLVLTFLLAAAQTSTLFVMFSAVYLTIIPFLIMGSGLAFFISVLHSGTVNRRLNAHLRGCHIRILIPSRAVAFDPSTQPFFFASARAMAAEPQTAVIIVSPYSWSTKGFGSRRMFFTARCEEERLYLVRKHYYFILRRRVLDTLDPHLSILY